MVGELLWTLNIAYETENAGVDPTSVGTDRIPKARPFQVARTYIKSQRTSSASGLYI
jgi:hypothetical protein